MRIRYKEKMTDGIEVNIQDEYEANEDSSKCTLQKHFSIHRKNLESFISSLFLALTFASADLLGCQLSELFFVLSLFLSSNFCLSLPFGSSTQRAFLCFSFLRLYFLHKSAIWIFNLASFVVLSLFLNSNFFLSCPFEFSNYRAFCAFCKL